MPDLLPAIVTAYLAVGLIVALGTEETVGSRHSAALGLAWPVTLGAFVLKSLGHAPRQALPQSNDTAQDECQQEGCLHYQGTCVITHEDRNEFSVRLVGEHGAGDEIGRLIIDPLSNKWVAMPADTTRPILGIYERGCEAVEALIVDDFESTSREFPGEPR